MDERLFVQYLIHTLVVLSALWARLGVQVLNPPLKIVCRLAAEGTGTANFDKKIFVLEDSAGIKLSSSVYN